MNFGKFSVNNSVLVNILMIAVLVLGALSLSRLPREQFSEVPFFWVNIAVPYPGVSAEDVEKSVTIKIKRSPSKSLRGMSCEILKQSVTTPLPSCLPSLYLSPDGYVMKKRRKSEGKKAISVI